MGTDIYLMRLLPYVMAAAAVSMAVTMAMVFKPLREFIKGRSKWFGELFSCPWCFSHWTCLIVMALGNLTVGIEDPWIDMFVTWLCMVVMCAPVSWLIFKSYSAMGAHDDD